MKWRRRWLFNLAASVSGTLFVGSVVVLALGWMVGLGSHFVRLRDARGLTFHLEVPGSFAITFSHLWSSEDMRRQVGGIRKPGQSLSDLMLDQWHPLPGITARRQYGFLPQPDGTVFRKPMFSSASFNLAWPILLSLIVPASWLISVIRTRRRQVRARAGFCVNCGYDLRATPDRCPECGAVISKSTRGG